MTEHKTFLDRKLAGEDISIESEIEKWHTSGSNLSLAKYLGFTTEQYELFVKYPALMTSFIASKVKNGLRKVKE